MLVASDPTGNRVVAWEAEKGQDYTCPECVKDLVLKQGPIICDHFAHRRDQTCGYGEGESAQHEYAKRQLTRWWPSIELEVPGIAPGRRADAVLVSGSRRFVIEIQATPISVTEWRERTADYEQAGVPLLWVWYSTLLTDHHPPKEYRIPAAALMDAKRRNNKLIVFRWPGDLELWSLTVPYRNPVYIRRVTKSVLAREDDRLRLPKPWESAGRRTLWIEPPIPRELRSAAEDAVIIAAVNKLEGRIVSIQPLAASPDSPTVEAIA